jgi:hypothetical protein
MKPQEVCNQLIHNYESGASISLNIADYDLYKLANAYQSLFDTNLALSDTVKDLSEQLEDIDCAYGDDLSVSD